MDSTEKLATYGTQDEENQSKNNTIHFIYLYVFDTIIRNHRYWQQDEEKQHNMRWTSLCASKHK